MYLHRICIYIYSYTEFIYVFIHRKLHISAQISEFLLLGTHSDQETKLDQHPQSPSHILPNRYPYSKNDRCPDLQYHRLVLFVFELDIAESFSIQSLVSGFFCSALHLEFICIILLCKVPFVAS